MASSSSKLEYLQRYMSAAPDAGDKKLRKKKKAKTAAATSAPSRMQIVDVDHEWQQDAPSRDAIDRKWEMDDDDEERPVVLADGDIIDDPSDLPVYVNAEQLLDELHATTRAAADANADANADMSPPRKAKPPPTAAAAAASRSSDNDASPPRRQRRVTAASDNDASPPRRRRSAALNDDDDASPPRRGRERALRRSDDNKRTLTHRVAANDHGDDDDASPPRRQRASPVDAPRASTRNNDRDDDDASPPRRARSTVNATTANRTDDSKTMAPATRRQTDARGRNARNDATTTSHKRSSASPRRQHHSRRSRSRSTSRSRGRDHDRHRRSRSRSPPRHSARPRHHGRSRSRSGSRDRHHRRRHASRSPRRSATNDDRHARHSRRSASPAVVLTRHVASKSSPPSVFPTAAAANNASASQPPAAVAVPGRAGLFTKDEFAVEHARKRQQNDLLRSAAAEDLGANAETVYRDKRGKKLDMLTEMVRQQEILDGKRKREARDEYEWGTGKVQKAALESDRARLEQLQSVPFARREDDADLEKLRRERVRAFDPVNSKIFLDDDVSVNKTTKHKKHKKQQRAGSSSHTTVKPTYAGPPAPSNRFGIMPGYRWDGVVRGTNWEEKLLLRENKHTAQSDEAYRYAVADM